MILNPNFEIFNIANDYLAIPLGEEAANFHGVVTLSEAAAYLLQKMSKPRTKGELIDLLIEEYDVDKNTAESDVDSILEKFYSLNLIQDS